jgi:HNH endonuclease
VIFAPAMRFLEQLVKHGGFVGPLAYHDPRWRRDRAPLLDHLGAVIDHIEAHSRGGACAESNFVTSCNKCNSRKSNGLAEEFARRSPPHAVKAKYGEPTQWDGLSVIFVLLLERNEKSATATELEWFRALRGSSTAPEL